MTWYCLHKIGQVVGVYPISISVPLLEALTSFINPVISDHRAEGLIHYSLKKKLDIRCF